MAHAAHVMGALGAVPFVGLTPQARDALGLRAVASGETCARAQIAYGATILSFLGGIHWGLAAVKHTVVKHWNPTPAQLTARYAWSVTPSLLAWAALSAPSEVAACGTLMGGLLACAGVDTVYARAGGYPRSLLPMRYGLTAAATLSLAATAFRGADEGERSKSKRR